MYVYQLDIAAIIVTGMLLLMMFLRRTYSTVSCKLYKGLLWLNLLSSVSDLVSSFTITNANSVPIFVNYLVNIMYLLSHNVTCVMFLVYVVVVTKGSRIMFEGKTGKIICTGIITLESLLLFTTPFTKWIFYMEGTAYKHGPLMPLLYIIAFIIMAYTLFLFVANWKRLNKLQNLTNISFLSILMISVIFQAIFPAILIESFCIAIALMMMNVATDNPAMYFYRNTYCFNQTAFNTMVNEKLQKKEHLSLLGMTFDGMMMFRSKFKDEYYYQKIYKIIAVLHKLYGQKNVYTFGGGTFVMEIGERSVSETVRKITLEVQKLLSTTEEKNFLIPHFCVLKCPEFAETVGEVHDSITKMLNEVYRTTGETITYASSVELKAKRRAAMITNKLHYAINHDGFEVYYQPIYSWRENKYTAVEALLRLKDQDAGKYIGPDEFIPIAEQTGMILDIDEIVFEKVCRFWQNSKLVNYGIKYVEVNLSKLELLNDYSFNKIEEFCNRYKVPKACINLEITETADVGHEKSAIISNTVNRMQESGFTFSLDDYGSGYSSAGYLAEMPFTLVKVDKNILWNAMVDKNFEVVLENAVRTVHRLNKKCVVEGVETQEMVDKLREMDCEFFQGYYYSKPLKEKELLNFLRTSNSIS